MKIASSLLLAFAAGSDVDGTTAHLDGCIWPDRNVLGTKISYADDPYADFTNLSGTGINSPYAEGTEVCAFLIFRTSNFFLLPAPYY